MIPLEYDNDEKMKKIGEKITLVLFLEPYKKKMATMR